LSYNPAHAGTIMAHGLKRLRAGFVLLAGLVLCGSVALWAWVGFPRLWSRSYEWHEVAPGTDHFRMIFPGTLTKSEQANKAADGRTFVSHEFRSSPAKGVVYGMSWWENPDQAAQTDDEIFAHFKQCGMKVFRTNAVSQKAFIVNGYPATYTFLFAPGNGEVWNLAVRVGPRIYSLWVLDPEGLSDGKNIRKFFKSFSPGGRSTPVPS
jgi:hypothetical protein